MKTGVVVTLGSIATATAIIGSVVGFWSDLGWVTPTQHNGDVVRLEQQIQKYAAESNDGWTEFRREWRCDEWMEHLSEKLKEQVERPNDVDLAEEIRRLRKKIDDNNCSDFED